MTLLLCADLHLTSKARDADRWNLFPWIREQARKYGIPSIAVLGDLTDAKDKHDAQLVNRLVSEMTDLSEGMHVYLLRGNHDCIDEQHPFFHFLNRTMNNIHFINQPRRFSFDNLGSCAFIPCTRDRELFAAQVRDARSESSYIFTHQTYDGCVSENGTALYGISPDVFKGYKGKVFSGDIHVAQKVRDNIEYVGAPYPIRFGDTYTPRCVLLRRNREQRDLHFPYQQKLLVELQGGDDALPSGLKAGSQLKLRVSLHRRELAGWPALRYALAAQAETAKLDLVGVELKLKRDRAVRSSQTLSDVQSAREIVEDYTQRKKVGGILRELGLQLITTGTSQKQEQS